MLKGPVPWFNGLITSLDMVKRSGRVGFKSGQLGCGSNGSRVILSGLKRGFGSIGLRVGSG